MRRPQPHRQGVRVDAAGPTVVPWPIRAADRPARQVGITAHMTNQLFEAALGIKSPWFVQGVDFDAAQRRMTISIDFVPGSRFAHAKAPGQHPVHDTQIKRLRHLRAPGHPRPLRSTTAATIPALPQMDLQQAAARVNLTK